MFARDCSYTEIAREFSRGVECIRKVLNRWELEATNERKHGTGLKRKTTVQEEQQIRDYAKSHKKDTKQQIINTLELNISKQSIARRLKDVEGLKRCKSVKKPALTEEHIDKRFDYALEHSNWTHECKSIVCMDENNS
ncbi:transposable element Tcb1 transposase-like protein, partial [Leptotrombidium deliense]